MRQLPAVRPGDVGRAPGGRRESREPGVVGRDGVLRGEDDELSRGEPDAEVPRAAVPELAGGDLVDDRAGRARPVGAVVIGARVDDDDLDGLVDRLQGDSGKTAGEVVAAVLDRDDDRDHFGVAARRNW